VAHEKSSTFQDNSGRWVNVDTVHGGKKQPDSVLLEWLKTGHIRPLGGKTFGSSSEAEDAARKRSKSFDKLK
jgi:hypothetical protein